MTIKEIYEKFGIPPNLAQHMLTVTKVSLFIKDHWIGPNLDGERIGKTALLHDLGNVIKETLLGYEGPDLEYWKDYWDKHRIEMIKKYGEDDHEVTRKMLEEIGIDPEIIETILNKSFGKSVETANSDDWYSKILLYADLRVLPNGVATLEERFTDVRERMPKYVERPDFEDLLNAGWEIEKKIQENINVPVSEINKQSVERSEDELLSISI